MDLWLLSAGLWGLNLIIYWLAYYCYTISVSYIQKQLAVPRVKLQYGSVVARTGCYNVLHSLHCTSRILLSPLISACCACIVWSASHTSLCPSWFLSPVYSNIRGSGPPVSSSTLSPPSSLYQDREGRGAPPEGVQVKVVWDPCTAATGSDGGVMDGSPVWSVKSDLYFRICRLLILSVILNLLLDTVKPNQFRSTLWFNG